MEILFQRNYDLISRRRKIIQLIGYVDKVDFVTEAFLLKWAGLKFFTREFYLREARSLQSKVIHLI